MWLQSATKTVCDFPVTLAGRVSCTPRLSHIQMPTHTFKEHKCMHAQTLAHTRTQAPKNPAGFGRDALTSGSQSKGCCSPVYNSTTDPLCSSCKFCSFSSALRRALCCFVKRRRRRGEEWRGKRTEEWRHCLCETAKSLCLHEGWDCACAPLCACVCVCVCARAPLCGVWPSTVHVCIKRAENKGPLVRDVNLDQCYRPNTINWSNGHTYFYYSASLLQPGKNRLATTSSPAATTSW